MRISRLDAHDLAILSGLPSKEVERCFYLYDDDRVALLRASEICPVKNHHINAPMQDTLERLARAPDADGDMVVRDYFKGGQMLAGPAGLRMHLGNAIEDWLVKNVLNPDFHWNWEQYASSYYYKDFNAVMLGHMDGIVEDGMAMFTGEVKSTSDINFEQVIAAIDHPDEVHSDLLDKYKRQMRTYAAMVFLSGDFERFTPCSGMLAVVNRNNCDYEVRVIRLFDEDDDIEGWLQQRIKDAVGGVHPLDGFIDKPAWASPSHPICKSCKFEVDCWGTRREPTRASDFGDTQFWVDRYREGDRLAKLGELYTKDAKKQFGHILDDANLDKLQLTDDVSVSRHTRAGNRRVDVSRLKADNLYDDYAIDGQPYEVMRVNVKR